MIIRDTAIIIAKRDFQEKDVILSCLTKENGTISGLVKSAKVKKRLKHVLEIGNLISIEHYFKENKLGILSVEGLKSYAYNCMSSKLKIIMIASLCRKIKIFLGDSVYNLDNISIFDILIRFLDSLEASDARQAIFSYIVIFKQLIFFTGYGFDVNSCRATSCKDIDKLIYLSPNSLAAISKEAGLPYKGKLMSLPRFFITENCNDVFCKENLLEGIEIINFAVSKILYENFHFKVSDFWNFYIDNIKKQIHFLNDDIAV